MAYFTRFNRKAALLLANFGGKGQKDGNKTIRALAGVTLNGVRYWRRAAEAFIVLASKARSFATWTTIRNFGSLKVVRLISFIPFVAFLLSFFFPFLDTLARLLSDFLHLPHPTSSFAFMAHAQQQVYIFFAGLLFFSAATLIFWLTCPPLIQRYGSCADYIIAENRIYDLNEHTLVYMALAAQYANLPSISHSNRLAVIGKDAESPTEDSIKISQMRFMYETLDRSNPSWARLTVWLYAIGIILVFSSSIKNIIQAILHVPVLLNASGLIGTH